MGESSFFLVLAILALLALAIVYIEYRVMGRVDVAFIGVFLVLNALCAMAFYGVI